MFKTPCKIRLFRASHCNLLNCSKQDGVTNTAVQVTNRLFTVLIDSGPSVFIGHINLLEIAVETNGVGTISMLAPRQQSTRYAIYAGIASGLSGTFSLT